MPMWRMLGALMAVALIAFACSAEEPDAQNTITVGLITDLSGRAIAFGKDIQAATDLAVRSVNDEGGINGATLVVDVRDSGAEVDQAVIAFDALDDNGVFAISGPLSSGSAEAVFKRAAENELPVITGTANTEGITQFGEGWAFRNTISNEDMYRVAMPVWMERYQLDTAVLIYAQGERVAESAASAIQTVATEVGLELAGPITFDAQTTEVATIVLRILETEGRGLIVLSGPGDAGRLARELVRQADERPVLGHPTQGGGDFFAQGGSDISNWVLPSVFDRNRNDPATRAYVEAITELDDELPTVPEAANHYDTIRMLAQIMREAGIDGTTPADEARRAIRDGLANLSGYQGIAGLTTFLPSGESDKTVHINVVMQGELEPLG